MVSQIPFHFTPFRKYDSEYFIVHSGVYEAHEMFSRIHARLVQDSDVFEMIYLHGPSGSGKKHLACGFRRVLLSDDIPAVVLIYSEDGELLEYNEDEEVPLSIERFIHIYQNMKSSGGLCAVLSGRVHEKNEINPHLASRFFSGNVVRLDYPQEEELYPVLVSLLERYHLRLPESRIRQIIGMVPGLPVYFEEISSKINDLIQERGRLTSSMLKEVILSDQFRIKES
jgi:chromosomal replication initiation ATPase DnaA